MQETHGLELERLREELGRERELHREVSSHSQKFGWESGKNDHKTYKTEMNYQVTPFYFHIFSLFFFLKYVGFMFSIFDGVFQDSGFKVDAAKSSSFGGRPLVCFMVCKRSEMKRLGAWDVSWRPKMTLSPLVH